MPTKPDWLRSIGDIVTVHCPADDLVDYESWLRGPIIETLNVAHNGAVHVVQPNDYKPADEDWRPYDGVPHVIARQKGSREELYWIDTWPRRM